MNQVKVIASKKKLTDVFFRNECVIISCINGYTWGLLSKSDKYDAILKNKKLMFVVDGVSAQIALCIKGIRANRICGRELIDTAKKINNRAIFVIAGGNEICAEEEKKINDFFGKNIKVINARQLNDMADIRAYANEISCVIPINSIVIMGISSPKQDALSVFVTEKRNDLMCLNVGAAVMDIINGSVGSIRIFSALRVEWLYRLVKNPLRTQHKIRTQICLMLSSRKCGVNVKLVK